MGGDLMNKLKTILACMIITLGILYLPEIHANASTVTIDEATFRIHVYANLHKNKTSIKMVFCLMKKEI